MSLDNDNGRSAAHLEILGALGELARSASEDPVSLVLAAVARSVLDTAGYSCVVLNLFRPAWDDYQAVIVEGSQHGVDDLLGTSAPRDAFERALDSATRRYQSAFFVAAGDADWQGIDNLVVPDIERRQDPEAWDPEDALFVKLTESDGEPLGLISVDEPRSGRRPSEDDLRLLHTICSFAERALRGARRTEQIETDRRLFARLTEASPEMARCETPEQLDTSVARIVSEEFGFPRVAIYRSEPGDDDHRLALGHGWSPHAGVPTTLSPATVDAAFDRGRPHGGCWLLDAREIPEPLRAAISDADHNGIGPRAWCDHALLIPWGGDGGRPSGFVLLGDPLDSLLPTPERCRSLRLLIDLAASVQTGLQQRALLARLASHDSLTGLRNRRGLEEIIARHDELALLLCDLDEFKAVNDRFGHDVGDQVLRCFADVLRDNTREGDHPVRLGGEEFCLVLPDVGTVEALAIAERIRQTTVDRLTDLVPGGVTVSIGLAAHTTPDAPPTPLLTRADRALYRAKRQGRNRSVVFATTDGSH